MRNKKQTYLLPERTIEELSKRLKINRNVLSYYIENNIPNALHHGKVISGDNVKIIREHYYLRYIVNFFIEKGYRIVRRNDVMNIEHPKEIKKPVSKKSYIRVILSSPETKRSKH